MKPAAATFASVLLAATLGGALTGCQDIPEGASTREFCSAGETFSASTTFKQGVDSAERLAEVGTPKGISARARDGFVQLVERVLDAKDGQDFIKASEKLSKDDLKNLKALNEYIQKTCKS